MKIYKINGGDDMCDYGVVVFEQKYEGQNVGEVCEKLLGNKDSYEDGEFGIYREEPIEKYEDKVFLRMRDKGDYDDLKHEKLFLETETI